MSGRGSAPKDPGRRARRNKDEIPGTPLRFEPAPQPELPAGVRWHPRTRAWWAMWGTSPQSEHFMATDWDFLIDTALMHSSMWSKRQWTLAAEVRLRVGKFGATPEDRARLRMQFASADEADSKRPPAPTARERYGDLRVVPDLAAARAAKKTTAARKRTARAAKKTTAARKRIARAPAKAATTRLPAKSTTKSVTTRKTSPVTPPLVGARSTTSPVKRAPAVKGKSPKRAGQ